jgi:tetratricopeptide (TPR) repeat protein
MPWIAWLLLLLAADDASGLLKSGRAALAREDYPTARAHFEKAAQLAPESGETQFLLGFFHYVDNDFVKAVAPLEKAVRLRPKHEASKMFLALAWDGLAEPERAVALLKPLTSEDARVAHARILIRLGRIDEAWSRLQGLSESRDALYEQARVQAARQAWSACIRLAERALALKSMGVTDRQLHYLLARAYGQAGQPDAAARHRAAFEAIPPRLTR